MIIKIKQNILVVVLSVVLVSLSGCSSLHDGKGIEHEPGNNTIKHKH